MSAYVLENAESSTDSAAIAPRACRVPSTADAFVRYPTAA